MGSENRRGDRNPNWRGNEVGYFTRHSRVKSAKGSASAHDCLFCESAQARDWAQIHGTSGMSPDHYFPLCRKCHVGYDADSHANDHAGRTAYARGNKHGQSKLTEVVIPDIRRQLAAGEQLTVIADRYGVSRAAIAKIRDGKTWRHQ